MADGTLASAVALPEQDAIQQPQDISTKRRNSSITDHDPKRRRLSADGDASPHAQRRPSQSSPVERERPDERKPAQRGRKEDERKRGQRLFGGLLGTLSQSSTSAAQKRRADIEKRQQDKLKNQAEEFDGRQSRRKERREAIRKKEMPFYEREAMQTRHSNMIAAAHFLKTRAEPVLFYKPWQLRARDETTLADQIKEAEATVSREVADFEARYPPEAFVYQPEPELQNEQPAEQQEQQQQKQQPSNAEQQENAESIAKDPTPVEHEDITKETPENMVDAQITHSNSDPTDDDGGEVVEDNEDTVIY
ncbi:hypothetical protein N7481_005210 [Penicillium waksmanii]|uniref:uncharacterized protein n=1 Tax=Penicillium waksmanii TaxID=69791 RepID=UPI002548B33D|nr:uncharacterized protein N7481_005210 [Penicillium waksmanii]KAJ5983111.1 hypothetical protein N7481_005210 [Penicillium waksmanii]